MDQLAKNRALLELGRRAVTYYLDTGLCVFCGADDVAGDPHEDCNVGELAGVEVTPERRAEKARQRGALDDLVAGRGVVLCEDCAPALTEERTKHGAPRPCSRCGKPTANGWVYLRADA